MLDSAENALVRSVETRLAEELAFLEKVVNIDSGTLNVAGVREVGRCFQQKLETLGFATRWIAMPDPMRRAGHLLAQRVARSGAGKRVLLIGHLDTIFEGRGHRFERMGDVARGAGVVDMKGGDVALLFALEALHEAGIPKDATVRVLLTGDEESPGRPTEISRRDLVETAQQSDVALSFESDSGRVAIGRRGLSLWSMDVAGAQGHSASVLRGRGAGAIYEASRILNDFRRAFSAHPNITVNPGLLLGGTDVTDDADRSTGTAAGKFNVVATTVTAKGDLRFVSDAEREEAEERMREIAAANLPKTSARLSVEDLVPGWPATDGNRAVLKLIDEVSRDLGQGPLEADDPGSRGFGDFNFIGALLPGADGLGVKGHGEHSPAETIDLTSLGPCTARAAIVISRLLRR